MRSASVQVVFAAALALGAAGCTANCACRAPAESAQAARPAAAPAPTPAPRLADGLPARPGPANVPRPAGAPGNLKILDWAGFTSAVSYTFDDGQPSQIEHYADLAAAGVRLTFFINSAGASWEAGFADTFSRAVRDGHEVANHTVHHCHADPDGTLRAGCAGASIAAEFDECTTFITKTLGAPAVWTSASPFGDTGYAGAATERFFLARGAMPGTVAPNDETDPFSLPIWGPAEHDGVEKFDAEIDRAHLGHRWVIMLLHSLGPTSFAWYMTVDVSAVTGSIAHAKSLGDVWIDSLANVGAYWRGQKLLAAVTPEVETTAAGTTQTWSWTLPPHFPPGKTLRVRVDGGTLSQNGKALEWNGHGYYEIALDAGSLTLSP